MLIQHSKANFYGFFKNLRKFASKGIRSVNNKKVEECPIDSEMMGENENWKKWINTFPWEFRVNEGT